MLINEHDNYLFLMTIHLKITKPHSRKESVNVLIKVNISPSRMNHSAKL